MQKDRPIASDPLSAVLDADLAVISRNIDLATSINSSLHLPIYLIKVADVDGDGDADIIVANDGAPSVVYFQAGVNTGSYLTATPIGGTPFDATSRTTKVVVADYTES